MEKTEIQDCRERLGLSRAEFGLLLGCNEQTVRRWERGGSVPGSLQLGLLRRFSEVVDMGQQPTDLRILLQTRGPVWVLWRLLSETEEL